MTTAFDPRERFQHEASPAEAVPPPASEHVPAPVPLPRSDSVEGLLSQYRDKGPVSSGALVEALLGSHGYVTKEVTPEPVAALGPTARTRAPGARPAPGRATPSPPSTPAPADRRCPPRC
jgi:hypothetical protein